MAPVEPRWFDSHCHLDFPAFDADRRDVTRRARECGVAGLFVPGFSLEQWHRLDELTAWRGVGVGVGVHPFALRGRSEVEPTELLSELPSHCRRLSAVAIGECGIDALEAKRGGATLSYQRAVLMAHLEWARRLHLPVVLHVVRAHGAVLQCLERCPPPRGGVVHAYSGSPELISRYVRLDFQFGFGAGVLSPRAVKARKALGLVPLDRLVLETDAPDQPLTPGRNEPAMLPRIGEGVAQLLGTTVNELAARTTENARRLFTATA